MQEMTDRKSMIVKRKIVRRFVREHNHHIVQVERAYYDALDDLIRQKLLRSVEVNASRKTLRKESLFM